MHNNSYNIKTVGPRAAKLITTLYEQNKTIFGLKNVQEILQFRQAQSCNFIRKLINRKIVTRLKSGLFILIPFELGKEREYIGNPLIVAREIMGGKDYYISHGAAMEVHGMVTQPQLVISVTTTKLRRPLDIMGVSFRFIHTEKKFFFGLSDYWVTKQEKIKVSDLERTVIDGLKQPQYCGGITEAAKGLWMKRQEIKVDQLINYALKMKIGAITRRLGYLLELYNMGNSDQLEIIRNYLTETYVKLDPFLPSEGKFIRRWRLRLNVSADELLAVVRT